MTGVIGQFLHTTKSHLSHTKGKFHVIMGNEACDLDSAACAISLAYFLFATEDKQTIYVPMLNISKSEYVLKTEVKYLLNKIGVQESSLVFKENLNLKSLCSSGKLKISIVDFNAFPKEQEHLDKCVVQIIDHHVRHKKVNLKAKTIVEAVGSCATLVTEYIIKNKDFNITEDMAMLLYGAIVIDTAFFKDKDKTTEKDIVMGKHLSQLIQNLNSEDYYKQILNAKLDDAGLTQVQILMKDMKILRKSHWSKSISIAVSVVQKSIFDFFSYNIVIENVFQEFLGINKADILIIMFLQITENSIFRYMALFSSNENLLKRVCTMLKDHKNPSLELEPIIVISTSPSASLVRTYDGSNPGSSKLHLTVSQLTIGSRLSEPEVLASFVAFKQVNASASRKVIIPILEHHIDDFLKYA